MLDGLLKFRGAAVDNVAGALLKTDRRLMLATWGAPCATWFMRPWYLPSSLADHHILNFEMLHHWPNGFNDTCSI